MAEILETSIYYLLYIFAIISRLLLIYKFISDLKKKRYIYIKSRLLDIGKKRRYRAKFIYGVFLFFYRKQRTFKDLNDLWNDQMSRFIIDLDIDLGEAKLI